jgi:hypothetical protein
VPSIARSSNILAHTQQTILLNRAIIASALNTPCVKHILSPCTIAPPNSPPDVLILDHTLQKIGLQWEMHHRHLWRLSEGAAVHDLHWSKGGCWKKYRTTTKSPSSGRFRVLRRVGENFHGVMRARPASSAMAVSLRPGVVASRGELPSLQSIGRFSARMRTNSRAGASPFHAGPPGWFDSAPSARGGQNVTVGSRQIHVY